MKFSRIILFVLLFVFCLSAVPIPVRAQESEVEVEPAETDDIDDILEANVDEPEEADDDVSYEEEEETPVIMKSLKLPVHPLTDIPEPSSDIEVTYKFLSEEFPVAEPIRVIVNLKNNGVTVYNVTNCMGSLNDVDDFSVYHQNFTERNFNSTLYPGYEMNFLYVFGIYNYMDPAEYQLALTVFYETDSDYYASTFLNETIEVIDKSSVWDIRMISIIVMMIVLAVFIYQYFFQTPKKVKKGTVAVEEFLPKDKKKN